MSEPGAPVVLDANEKRWVRVVEGIRASARARWLFYGVLGLTGALDVWVPREHAVFGWEGMWGFSAGYGFISCVLIILVSKGLGHAGLMRREDYYD